MGTRCLTVFNTSDDTEIVVLYRQFDGYPDGHGVDLARLMVRKDGTNRELVNGYTDDSVRARAWNGMACLAAEIVGRLKLDRSHERGSLGEHGCIGGFYLNPAGTRDTGEEFIYTIRKKDSIPHITIEHTYADDEEGNPVFEGTASELLARYDKAVKPPDNVVPFKPKGDAA